MTKTVNCAKDFIMNNKEFNILYFLLTFIIVAVLLTSSWEAYLHYLNRKLIIQELKTNNTRLSVEQIQGLINSKQ